MYHQKMRFLWVTIALAIFSIATLTSCEKKDSEKDKQADDDNGNGNGNGTENVWEPYKFSTNTYYSYDYEYTENGEVTSSGIVEIKIYDPKVEIIATIDGEEIVSEANIYDDIFENFTMAIITTPLYGILYTSYWAAAFSDRDLEVGASWSYSYQNSSFSYAITGKETYAGYEGYVIESTWQDEGETITWHSCICIDVPLPLMAEIEYDNSSVQYMELTEFSEMK